MLEPIFKGLVEWIYQIMVDIMSYASTELLSVMSMDLSYFEETAPIIFDIRDVFIALGWALLIGNMLFQSLKAIISGIGFESEDPKLIFFRTFVFSFLLLASRQICDIGLGITSKVIEMLELPSAIEVRTPDESMFSMAADAKWMLVIIVGIVLMVQMVKLLFEIGERYVITSILTFFAPLAFSMGGSRNTNDIFKGWVRMYCSMLIMMMMNIVFLKLIMSAMSRMASGSVLVWLVFVVALTRVARKIDSHIGKIGLNPAQTGDGIGSRLPGMMTLMAVRVMSSAIGKSISGAKGSTGRTGRYSGISGRSRGTGAAGYGLSRSRTDTSSNTNTQTAGSGGMHSETEKTSSVKSAEKTSATNVGKSNKPNNQKVSVSNGRVKEKKPVSSGYVARTENRSNGNLRPPIERSVSSNSVKKEKDVRPPLDRNTVPTSVREQAGIGNDGVSQSTIRNEKESDRTKTNGKLFENGRKSEFNQQEIKGVHDTQYKKGRTEHVASVQERQNTERINPEYPRGRHNPAAVNKKKKQNYYQKRIKDENYINRGKHNGKHKR